MELNFRNVTKQNRKELVAALEGITESKAKYMGMPTAAYEVGEYIVTKEGTLKPKNELHPDYLAQLLDTLAQQGCSWRYCLNSCVYLVFHFLHDSFIIFL